MQNTIALHLPDNSSAAQVVLLSKSVGRIASFSESVCPNSIKQI